MSSSSSGNVGTEPPMDAETEELWSSRALLLVLCLLILSFWVSYTLKIRKIRTIHETIVALFAGMFVGLVLRLSPGAVVQDMVSFKPTIMMNVLLPPIILSSGYDLRQEQFFRNFAVILVFAFVGTFISAMVIGVVVYIYGLLGFEGLDLTMVECLSFGSTLSATDPVTILAIFNQLKVEPKLFNIVFGESLLNDAVAIVMFETLSQFHSTVPSIFSFFHGTGIFLLVFFISMMLGIIFGLGLSLILKHSQLGRYPEIETCLVLLVAYTSYFSSNAVMMSGIVSLLFCGITLKHYAYHNMSRKTQRTSRYIFHTLSQLSENFIFIYLGLTLFTQVELVYKPMFIFVSALGVCIARYASVFPLSKFINFLFRFHNSRSVSLSYNAEPLIPHSHQMMLFWAGLRGAVGVALAAGLQGKNAMALQTTVLTTVVITMVVFGGTTTRMIEIVGVRVGVEEEGEASSEEEEDIEGGWGEEDGYRLVGGRGINGNGFQEGGPTRKLGVVGGYNDEMLLSNPNSPYFDGGFDRSQQSPHPQSASGAVPSPNRQNSFGRNLKPGTNNYGSQLSLNSLDSDNEVLPDNMSPSLDGPSASTQPSAGAVWRDGQWFTVLDEKFLLPTFSNATASRRSTMKKSMRSARNSGVFWEGRDSPLSDDGGLLSPGGVGSPRPMSPLGRETWTGGSGVGGGVGGFQYLLQGEGSDRAKSGSNYNNHHHYSPTSSSSSPASNFFPNSNGMVSSSTHPPSFNNNTGNGMIARHGFAYPRSTPVSPLATVHNVVDVNLDSNFVSNNLTDLAKKIRAKEGRVVGVGSEMNMGSDRDSDQGRGKGLGSIGVVGGMADEEEKMIDSMTMMTTTATTKEGQFAYYQSAPPTVLINGIPHSKRPSIAVNNHSNRKNSDSITGAEYIEPVPTADSDGSISLSVNAGGSSVRKSSFSKGRVSEDIVNEGDRIVVKEGGKEE